MWKKPTTKIAATGSWDLVDYRTGEFWRMEAVENHWRKTPHFAELIFQEIPEESSRVAGFKTGNLDTTLLAFDSLSQVESVDGAEIMRVPGGGEAALTFYGQVLRGYRHGRPAARLRSGPALGIGRP